MKRIFLVFTFCLWGAICSATNPPTVDTSAHDKQFVFTIKVDTVCNALDSTYTITVDTATLHVLEKNIMEKRVYADSIDSLKVTLTNYKKNNTLFVIWGMIVTIGLLVLTLIYFLKDRKKLNDLKDKTSNLRDKIINTVIESSRVSKHLQDFLNNGSRAYQTFSTEDKKNNNNDILNRIDILEKNFTELNDIIGVRQDNIKHVLSQNRNEKLSSNTCKYYAECINDNRFIKVKETQTDDSIFELSVQPNGVAASVTICKNAYRKVLNNHSYLNGCDIQIIENTSVEVLEEGIAERNDDNKWVVGKQIKVILR